MRGLWLGAVMLLLASCSSKSGAPGLSLKSISLVSASNTNLNSGLTVDFVAVYDKNLLDKLQGMTSTQYFSSIDQLRRDNMSMFDVWRWELVPNQILENYKPVFEQSKAWGGLFFADYQTPGDHRVGIGLSSYVRVTLGEQDIEAVAPEEAPEDEEEKKAMTIYPVKETVLLNTHTPHTGMTQKNYENMKKGGGAQKAPTQPQATVGE